MGEAAYQPVRNPSRCRHCGDPTKNAAHSECSRCASGQQPARNPQHLPVEVNCCGHRWADPDDVDHASDCPTNGQGRIEWWCADHGYGCEPSTCPCGHTLNCDCWGIANDH